jgi:integrase
VVEGTPFQRSDFTAPVVSRWLHSRVTLTQKRRPSDAGSRRKKDPEPRSASGPTKRRYLAAAQSFSRYLCEVGVLASNPIRDVSAPPANPPRDQFLELPDVERLVNGTEPPFRALFALAYGGGIEVGALLRMIESDITPSKREVHVRGTKTRARDRVARISDWVWPHVQAHLRTLTPGERMFRGMDRWDATSAHRARCVLLELGGYRLHDARRHWAVRMVRTGMPLEMVANQLGHVDAVMVARVCRRFVPNHVERDRWEIAAAALDAEKWGAIGTAAGTAIPTSEPPEITKSSNPLGLDDFESSRGGTRTRDPGIMSAVL